MYEIKKQILIHFDLLHSIPFGEDELFSQTERIIENNNFETNGLLIDPFSL